MPKVIDPEPVPGMPRLLSSGQVRKLLGCSLQTLNLNVRAGRIHFVKFAGSRLYPSEQFNVEPDEMQAILDFPVSLDELEQALMLYRDPRARAAAEAAYRPPLPKPFDSRQNAFAREPRVVANPYRTPREKKQTTKAEPKPSAAAAQRPAFELDVHLALPSNPFKIMF